MLKDYSQTEYSPFTPFSLLLNRLHMSDEKIPSPRPKLEADGNEKDSYHGHPLYRVPPGGREDLDLFDGSIDPIYEAKACILNHAIQEIGMGRYQVHFESPYYSHFVQYAFAYQWYLFIVTGFGWYA